MEAAAPSSESFGIYLPPSETKERANGISKEEIVQVGDWCAFEWPGKHVGIGKVLSFSYLSEKGSSRNYSRLSAPVHYPGEKGKGRGIACLCTWYSIETSGKLVQCKMDYHGHHNIDSYICTVFPKFSNKTYKLHTSVLQHFKKYKKLS